MATGGWGLDQPKVNEPGEGEQPRKKARVALTPQASQAAHKGIVWLHAGAIGIWLIVVLTLGAISLAGRAVPPIVLIIGVGAALGHAAFLSAHVLLARQARRRAAGV